MKTRPEVELKDVQEVYSGAEGELWELLMGEQIHMGGFQSSMDLAERAGLKPGMEGVDLCCCTGAGMRFLVRFRGARRMRGVDATPKMVELGRTRCAAEGLSDRIDFTVADVCASGLPDGCADFVWGEDAWCYVKDKSKLIAEAVRLVKPGGVIAFTDWVEGRGLTDGEASRYLTFMKFPSIVTLEEYARFFQKNGCCVDRSLDTGRFAPQVDLYLEMVGKQLTYDALRLVGNDPHVLERIAVEMKFLGDLARAGKVAQGLMVAKKG